MEKLITQVTSLSDTDFKAKYITLSKPKPKPKPKPKLNKYHHNQLIKHYKILDSLITAALVSEEALLGAREKIRVNKNGKEAFRALVSKLCKEELIKLRDDLRVINFFANKIH